MTIENEIVSHVKCIEYMSQWIFRKEPLRISGNIRQSSSKCVKRCSFVSLIAFIYIGYGINYDGKDCLRPNVPFKKKEEFWTCTAYDEFDLCMECAE